MTVEKQEHLQTRTDMFHFSACIRITEARGMAKLRIKEWRNRHASRKAMSHYKVCGWEKDEELGPLMQ